MTRSGRVLLVAVLAGACGTPTVPKETVHRFQSCSDGEARAALDRARNLLAAGQRDETTLGELETALRRCPEFVPAHLLYQETCTAMAQQARMATFYRDLPVPPQSPVRDFLAARLTTDENQALQYLRRCTETDPQFFYARVVSARILRKRGQSEDAIRALEAALTTNEDLGAAWLETGALPDLDLAELKEETNSPLEAAVHYRRYLAQRPQDRRARQNLVRLLIEQDRDLDEAEASLALLLPGHPEDLELRLLGAALQWRRGRTLDAARGYQSILQSSEDQPVAKARALLNLGNLFFSDRELKDWRKARLCYRRFLGLARLETQADLLDQMFSVPHRIAEIEKALPGLQGEADTALPAPADLPLGGGNGQ